MTTHFWLDYKALLSFIGSTCTIAPMILDSNAVILVLVEIVAAWTSMLSSQTHYIIDANDIETHHPIIPKMGD